jgi:hypothetical protein
MSFTRPAIAALIPCIACVLASPLEADTVYLKNGSWIDGRVRARNQKVVEIEIGKIGKMEINAEEIYEIEKNNRTGEESYARKAEEERNLLRFTREGKRGGAVKGGADTQEEGEGETEAPSEGGPPAKDAGAKKGETPKPPVPPVAPPQAKDNEKSKIDPELKARIEGLVADLQRQKPQYRTRAERHLKAIGQPALPFLLPLVTSDQELTRISVFHLFYDFGDESVIEACIEALLDDNEYARDYANKALQRVTHEDFGFEAGASPRRRENAQEKWKKWWENEKQELAKERALSQKDEPTESDAKPKAESVGPQTQGDSKS